MLGGSGGAAAGGSDRTWQVTRPADSAAPLPSAGFCRVGRRFQIGSKCTRLLKGPPGRS